MSNSNGRKNRKKEQEKGQNVEAKLEQLQREAKIMFKIQPTKCPLTNWNVPIRNLTTYKF